MAGSEGAGRAAGLQPGWDRRDPWTLRFLDPGLERSYASAMAAPGRLRLRIASLVGAGVWLSAVLLSPLLGVAVLPFVVVNNYGPSECTVVATSGVIEPNADVDGPPSIGPLECGRWRGPAARLS